MKDGSEIRNTPTPVKTAASVRKSKKTIANTNPKKMAQETTAIPMLKVTDKIH